jgi:peptidoglycan DL-endopeptidase CwlO
MYRYRYRYRYRRRTPASTKAAVAVGAALVLGAGHAHSAHAARAGHHVTHAAAVAIAYARAQIGCSYVWGGAGPCGAGFDCSGLVMQAWAAAGVPLPRTSQQQWAGLRHVSTPRPGDLVFFPGSDGSWSAPGHVALVISAHQMIQAYAPGTPIEVSPLSGAGAGGIVGYARPWSN